jgi:hypothetical protein
MQNFSIGFQIEKEINDFRTKKIRLASMAEGHEATIRYLGKDEGGYFFNQTDTLSIIDLYWNSQFENGPTDRLGQQKIFMNVGKFRTQVASKQIAIGTKDFKFYPEDYQSPWVSIFMQKDFKEWSKESYFANIINDCEDNFPKYGTIVLKKVSRELKFVPLQNLINEQTADSLETAAYVIEEHPSMSMWEVKTMKGWNTTGLSMRFDETMDVHERYGYVPLKWLKEANSELPAEGDDTTYVDSLVICGKARDSKNSKNNYHVFFAGQISSRPYREEHYDRQHGRWLGMGVMEDLVQNQKAKNIIVNLQRRSLHWSSKVIAQSANQDIAAKNLVKDVSDGEILEVGANGAITKVDLASRNQGEFQQVLNEWERNSDQKAFTYEVATGEGMPSGTPFRLGVILSNAVNSYFGKKKEKLGLFLKQAISDFLIPQFIKDMSNEDRVLAMFSDEAGFEILKKAAMDFVRSETMRISLLSGKAVDATMVEQAVQPFQEVQTLFFKLSKMTYQEAKFKFDFTVTGEEIDLKTRLDTLGTLYMSLLKGGDPRAEKVLERIATLSGESMAGFGSPAPMGGGLPARTTPGGALPQPNAALTPQA